jgi:serine/threonine protein kinase
MTKQLVVLAGPDEGRVFNLGADVFLLGRSRATESQLLDPNVSRVHCQVVPEGEQYALVDFDSVGGTFVNGKPIERHLLQNGDLVRIGGTRLQYVDDRVPGAAPAAPPAPPGAPPRSATEWVQKLTGQTLGSYEIGAPLARGRTGYVFHSQDPKRNTPVAVKVLKPEFAEDDKRVQHFVEAMKAVLPLNHANLLKIYGAGKTGAHCWVAMEYIAGDSLAAVISRIHTPGKVAWSGIARVGLFLSRALEYAHEKKLVHQNVTPQNVLVTKHPQDTKLIDLMLATATEEDPTQPISAAGTPSDSLPYLAPERTDGASAVVDARTDLYSLAATLYAMFTGKPPFQGDTVDEVVAQIRLDSPPRLRSFPLDIPAPMEQLLRRSLAKRPQDRPASAAEVRKELEALLRAHAPPAEQRAKTHES